MNPQLPTHYYPAMRRVWLSIVCAIAVNLFFGVGIVYAVDTIAADEKIYQRALDQARQGEFADALRQFEGLIKSHPDNRRYYFDYIAVLGWAEYDQKVVDQLPQLEVSGTPVYVLETVAKSARNLRKYQISIDFYRASLRKDKQRVQSRRGLAMALVDNGQADEALQVLDAAPGDQASMMEVLEARAYVLYMKQDYFSALAMYEKILTGAPKNRDAQRGQILATARLGAPHEALRMGHKSPKLLSNAELDAIEEDAIATEIRWGRLRQGSSTQRYLLTDKAINHLHEKLQGLNVDEQAKSSLARRYQFDLIVALADRQRMSEVIEVYEQLVVDGVVMPAFVLASAADAYLYLEQPEHARDLYRQVLVQQPDNFDSSIGLFYAYLEIEDHEQAHTIIDELANRTPIWIKYDEVAQPQPNPQKIQADTTAAMARAFSDQLEYSYQSLRRLNMQAPYNADIRSDLAYVSFLRGWPRHALSDFELALAADPGHLGARSGHANALLNLYEFQQAETEIQILDDEYPGSKGVVDLQRLWEVHNMHELRIDVARGLNSGFQEGSDDLTLNTYLYARPQHNHYRPYLLGHLARAKFPQGNVNYRRYGVGLEYRRRDIELIGELTTGAGDQNEAGLGARLNWIPDDYWRFDFAVDSYSNDIPLRARLDDIDGWSTSLNTAYRYSESRRIDLRLQRIDFSDDNLRTGATFTYMERLVTGPRYKLDGTLELSMSQNTRDDAPYFNPEADAFQGVMLTNEWLTLRRYARALRQRLGLGLGNYHQNGFGSHGTWSARYEHDWGINDQLNLMYGISRSRNIYDGDSELRSQVDLSLTWRF